MVGVTSLGVGSGLDLQSLVDGLVAAESQLRLGSITTREAAATEKISAYGLLSSALSEFDTSLTSLANFSSFEERTTTTTNSDAFSVSASLDAALGSFSLEVISAGAAQSLTGSGFVDITGTAITSTATDIGGGGLTIQQGTQAAFTISIAANASSLDEIATAINGAAGNTGVSASVVSADTGPVLVVKSTETGSDNEITITVDDIDGNDIDTTGLSQLAFDTGITPRFTQTVAADDAQISVAGQTITSTSGSNFSNVITGVSIEALAATTQVESFTIGKNTSKANTAIEAFVEAYNTLIDSVSELGAVGVEGVGGGPLVGDSVLRTLASQLRSSLFTSFESTLPIGLRSLSDIGISFDREGKLNLDSSRLSEVVDSDFQNLVQLFASTGQSIAQIQEYQSIAYAGLSTEPGDLTFTFSQGEGDSFESFSVDINGLDLVAARDAINSAGDNFGITAAVILEDDGGGGSQARLIINSDTAGASFTASATDNGTSDPVSIFSLSTAAEAETSQGIISRIQAIVDGFLGEGSETGIITSRTDGLDTEVERLQDERLAQQRRLEDFEARLQRQYASLDLLVSNLQSNGDFLLSQLNSISQITNRSNSS